MGTNASKCRDVKEIHQNGRNLKKIVVSKEEWKDILEKGPGFRMYKGLQTLFYNGEKLWEGDFYNGKPLVYNRKERQAWEQIIVLPGVKIIPKLTFKCCKNVKRVIMADTVTRVEKAAFTYCASLIFEVFREICKTCGEIGNDAFLGCNHLLISSISHRTRLLSNDIIRCTALMRRSPFETNELGEYCNQCQVNSWARDINQSELHSLHLICSSLHPSMTAIQAHLNKFGLESLEVQNTIGITPLHYLAENPSIAIEKEVLINRYVNVKSIKSTDDSERICEIEQINRYIMEQMGMK